jgi:hypothetical protein
MRSGSFDGSRRDHFFPRLILAEKSARYSVLVWKFLQDPHARSARHGGAQANRKVRLK